MARNRHKSKEQKIVDEIKDIVPSEVQHSTWEGGKARSTHLNLELRTEPICWGLPFDEVMFSAFFENYVALDHMPWDYVVTTRNTYLPKARNYIHNLFLNKLGGTHLFMLDSDVMPPPGIIKSLLDHKKDIVGGWYVKKEMFAVKDIEGNQGFIQRPVVYDFDHHAEKTDEYRQRTHPGKGLESVGAAGAGCWLMSRKVAEALGESPYDMERGGEDMALCRKVKEAGFDLWIDWNLNCAHLGVMRY